jgi:hypothetical protein
MILLHLMNLILDMSMSTFNSLTCSQLDQLPLPCSRAMWEAESRSAWEDEYKKYLSNMKGGRMFQCGDLRQMRLIEVSSLGGDVVDGLSAWSKGLAAGFRLKLLQVDWGRDWGLSPRGPRNTSKYNVCFQPMCIATFGGN